MSTPPTLRPHPGHSTGSPADARGSPSAASAGPAPREPTRTAPRDEQPWSAATPSGTVATVRSAIRWASPSTTALPRSARHGNQYVTIARGAYLPTELLASVPTPWERRRLVDIARIVVVQTHLSPDVLFCRESAALLRGIPLLDHAPDVHALTTGRQDRMRAGLPAIRFDGRALSPAVRVRLHHSADEGGPPSSMEGVPMCSPQTMLAELARFCPAREAVASLSVGLHLGTRFDRRQSERSREAEASAKERLAKRIATGTDRRGRARGVEILRVADAGCESIAEGALVWFLHAYGAKPWRTQHEVVVDGRSLFPDVAFPEIGVLLEVEGFGKLGTTAFEVRHNAQQQMSRGSRLEAADWRVIHLPATLVLGPPDELFTHLWAVAPEIFDPGTRGSPLFKA